MDRRELLALAGIATLVVPSPGRTQSAGGELRARLIHIYATPDGESHRATVEIANDAGEIPVTAMTARAYARNAANANAGADWHTAPRRQFAINMTGELEVELTDGTRRKIGSDLVYLEDLTGKGHVTRPLGPITNVFLHVPDDFDVVAWAAGR